ncbi:MAG: hypothetical protein ABF242_03260 [Flavobacteriales bacterium]
MKSIFVFIAALSFVAASCNSGKVEQTIQQDGTVTSQLTFEDTVKFHTQKYCDCSGPLNDFVANTNEATMDSVDFADYKRLQEEFLDCFDPQGAIRAFGQSLDPAKRTKQKELFNTYRQELCPNVVPKS